MESLDKQIEKQPGGPSSRVDLLKKRVQEVIDQVASIENELENPGISQEKKAQLLDLLYQREGHKAALERIILHSVQV